MAGADVGENLVLGRDRSRTDARAGKIRVIQRACRWWMVQYCDSNFAITIVDDCSRSLNRRSMANRKWCVCWRITKWAPMDWHCIQHHLRCCAVERIVLFDPILAGRNKPCAMAWPRSILLSEVSVFTGRTPSRGDMPGMRHGTEMEELVAMNAQRNIADSLQSIPNVEFATEGDLHLLGVRTVDDLVGRDPFEDV